MANFFSANTSLLWAAVVSAIVSAFVSYFFRKREARHKLEVEYEYEQRKKLRDLIGRYHGRLLNAAITLNYRFWNFYSNPASGWLDVRGNYKEPRYYFVSFVHRFSAVSALIRQFENEAVYVDARIAKKKDFVFLNYVASLHWAMTDVALFDGLTYDTSRQTDHFFSDNFRTYSEACIVNGEFLSYQAFSLWIAENRSIDPVLEFFDGLKDSEDRLRLDRLIIFHLLLIAFINSFGYKTQSTPDDKLRQVVAKVRNRRMLDNLIAWLPRHGLGKDPEARRIIRAWKAVKGPTKSVPQFRP